MALPRLTKEQVKEDAEQQLKKFKRTKDFLIAIDTDGCVTDNMSGKQILIFHPQFMEFYQLWEIVGQCGSYTLLERSNVQPTDVLRNDCPGPTSMLA